MMITIKMNETFENTTKEALLLNLGSTWIFDGVFLFLFPPLGMLSCAANLISYRVFSKKCFNKKPLYTYLRTVCLNSALISFIFSISFVCDSKRFLSLSNMYIAAWFRCFVKIPVLSTAYFNGCLLDIILALERLCQLTDQKDKFNRIPAAKFSALIFFLCLLVNLPYFFVFEVQKVYYTSEESTGFIYHYGESKFALGTTGTVVKNVNYFIRDILTLVVLIVLNILTLIKLKKNFLNHNQLTQMEKQFTMGRKNTLPHSSSSSSTLAMMMITSNFKNTAPISRNNRASSSNNNNNNNNKERESNNDCLLDHRSRQECATKIHRKNLVVSVCYEANKMVTKMVLIICFLSTLEHLFFIISLQLFSVPYFRSVKWNFTFMTNVTMFGRHSVNIVLFYCYNQLFRKRFLK